MKGTFYCHLGAELGCDTTLVADFNPSFIPPSPTRFWCIMGDQCRAAGHLGRLGARVSFSVKLFLMEHLSDTCSKSRESFTQACRCGSNRLKPS